MSNFTEYNEFYIALAVEKFVFSNKFSKKNVSQSLNEIHKKLTGKELGKNESESFQKKLESMGYYFRDENALFVFYINFKQSYRGIFIDDYGYDTYKGVVLIQPLGIKNNGRKTVDGKAVVFVKKDGEFKNYVIKQESIHRFLGVHSESMSIFVNELLGELSIVEFKNDDEQLRNVIVNNLSHDTKLFPNYALIKQVFKKAVEESKKNSLLSDIAYVNSLDTKKLKLLQKSILSNIIIMAKKISKDNNLDLKLIDKLKSNFVEPSLSINHKVFRYLK